MPSYRMCHTEESIKREISAIIRELNDPRVRDNLIDIVKINLSKDLSLCHVYVSSIKGMNTTNKAVEGLNSAVTYIRKQLGNRLEIRRVPDIKFKATDVIEYGMRMMERINNLSPEGDKE